MQLKLEKTKISETLGHVFTTPINTGSINNDLEGSMSDAVSVAVRSRVRISNGKEKFIVLKEI